MAHVVETQWMGKMQFNSLVNDHTIVMDGPEKVGGEDHGPIPKPLVLTALAGCTGMDENKEAALKAVTDSQEKYCGVSSMLKKALPLTWEIHYNGQQVFNNKEEAVFEVN